MKRVILLFAVLLMAGCATFGIHNLNFQEGREGKDYVLSVNAWDNDANNVQVTFVYRINAGAWKEKQGEFNGSVFEAVIAGNEMVAGKLEYYAYMINAKGKKVSSSAANVSILSFAQAKNKAVKEYQARLSDGGTGSEYYYNESVSLKLKASGSPSPTSVSCTISNISGTQTIVSKNTLGGLYEILLPPVHKGSSISYQWNVSWNDPDFGQISVQYPTTPAIISIVEQAILKARLEKDFAVAFSHTGPVSGNFFEPATVKANLGYTSLLTKFSKGNRSVNLVLKRYGFSKVLVMNEVSLGLFSVQIPVSDMEQGWLSYSFQYSDVFADVGTLMYEYPIGSALNISYKNFEQLKSEAVAVMREAFVHTPPVNGVENMDLGLVVTVTDNALRIISMDLELTGLFSLNKASSFVYSGADYKMQIPKNWVKAGDMKYKIHATVRDPKFGDVKVVLPSDNVWYTATIKSFAEYLNQQAAQLEKIRIQKQNELVNSLKHFQPEMIYWGKDFSLTLMQNPLLTGSTALIYYRYDNFGKYATASGVNQNGTWIFQFNHKISENPNLNYYFFVAVNDAQVGPYSAMYKDSDGGDFSLVPQHDNSSGNLPQITPLPTVEPVNNVDDNKNIEKIRSILRTCLFHVPPATTSYGKDFELSGAITVAPANLTIVCKYVTPSGTNSGVLTMIKSGVGYIVTIPAKSMTEASISYSLEVSTKYTMKNGSVQTIMERFPIGNNDWYKVSIKKVDTDESGTYYKGNSDDQSGIEFYYNEDKAIGLSDAYVMVKIQNLNIKFQEFKMERKGKRFSYKFDTNKLPIGTRIEYYYVIKKKGNTEEKITDANNIPFYTVIH